MSDPMRQLKQELLVAAERQHGQALLAPESRRRWLERFVPGRRRRLVVVLAAVALATVVTTAGWAIVREVVLDKGFIGLPPVGATPSTPESGELEIFYWGHGDPGTSWRRPWIRAWVYADGRLISWRTGSDFPRARTPLHRLPRAAADARGSRALAIGGRFDRLFDRDRGLVHPVEG